MAYLLQYSGSWFGFDSRPTYFDNFAKAFNLIFCYLSSSLRSILVKFSMKTILETFRQSGNGSKVTCVDVHGLLHGEFLHEFEDNGLVLFANVCTHGLRHLRKGLGVVLGSKKLLHHRP